jgi:hypothetical protein
MKISSKASLVGALLVAGGGVLTQPVAVAQEGSVSMEVSARIESACTFSFEGGADSILFDFGEIPNQDYEGAELHATPAIVEIVCSEPGVLQAVASLGENWVEGGQAGVPVRGTLGVWRALASPGKPSTPQYVISPFPGGMPVGSDARRGSWWSNAFDGGVGGQVYEAPVEAGVPHIMTIRARMGSVRQVTDAPGIYSDTVRVSFRLN